MYLTINFIHQKTTVYNKIRVKLQCVPKKVVLLLFLQYIWLLLTDFNSFFTITIRNDQSTYLE